MAVCFNYLLILLGGFGRPESIGEWLEDIGRRLAGWLSAEHSAEFWFTALLVLTVLAALTLLSWLMLLNWKHERRVRLEKSVRDRFEVGFPEWLFRDPDEKELVAMQALNAAELAVFMRLCNEQVQIVGGEFKERLEEALDKSGLLQREINRMHHRKWWMRADACWNLGRLGIKRATEPLMEKLEDRNATVRVAAIIALSNLRAVEAVVPIINSLERFKGWSDMRASMALRKIGPEIIPQIEMMLKSENLSRAAMKASLQIMGQLNALESPAIIRELAHHKDTDIRISAIRALSRMEADESSVELCIEALGDTEWAVRAIAAQSLGFLGDRSAILALEKSMKDGQYWVRHHAAEALGRLGPEGRKSLERQSHSADKFVSDMAQQMLYLQRKMEAQYQ